MKIEGQSRLDHTHSINANFGTSAISQCGDVIGPAWTLFSWSSDYSRWAILSSRWLRCRRRLFKLAQLDHQERTLSTISFRNHSRLVYALVFTLDLLLRVILYSSATLLIENVNSSCGWFGYISRIHPADSALSIMPNPQGNLVIIVENLLLPLGNAPVEAHSTQELPFCKMRFHRRTFSGMKCFRSLSPYFGGGRHDKIK